MFGVDLTILVKQHAKQLIALLQQQQPQQEDAFQQIMDFVQAQLIATMDFTLLLQLTYVQLVQIQIVPIVQMELQHTQEL